MSPALLHLVGRTGHLRKKTPPKTNNHLEKQQQQQQQQQHNNKNLPKSPNKTARKQTNKQKGGWQGKQNRRRDDESTNQTEKFSLSLSLSLSLFISKGEPGTETLTLLQKSHKTAALCFALVLCVSVFCRTSLGFPNSSLFSFFFAPFFQSSVTLPPVAPLPHSLA
jgi:hypothetical protein